MRIGVDFDNTIVDYDAVFHRVGCERALIPASLPASKVSVRQYLRECGKEEVWTELQGHVYGARMQEVVAYPGAIDFFRWAKSRRIETAIVSHKTRYPFLGVRHDLHQAARGWVENYLMADPDPLVSPGNVYFELTKQDKIQRIAQLDPDCFIDDLPEILLAEEFPVRTARILFDTENMGAAYPRLIPCPNWQSIRTYVESRWKMAN